MFVLNVDLPAVTSQALTQRDSQHVYPKGGEQDPSTSLGEVWQVNSSHQILFHCVYSVEPTLYRASE